MNTTTISPPAPHASRTFARVRLCCQDCGLSSPDVTLVRADERLTCESCIADGDTSSPDLQLAHLDGRTFAAVDGGAWELEGAKVLGAADAKTTRRVLGLAASRRFAAALVRPDLDRNDTLMFSSDSLAAAFAERLGRRVIDSPTLEEMWCTVEDDGEHCYSLSFIDRALDACESLETLGVDVDLVLDGNGNAHAVTRRGSTPIAARALNVSGELVA